VTIDDETDPIFMKSFIKPGPLGFRICEICTAFNKRTTKEEDSYLIATENIYSHIQTDLHRSQTQATDIVN